MFFKVRLKSYDIGIGRTLLHFVRRGIIFRFKLIPVGGAVVPYEEDYEGLELYKKLIIAISGVISNIVVYLIGIIIFAKGDLNIVLSLIRDTVLLIVNYLSYDNLALYDNSFSLLLREEINSLHSILLNNVIIINLVLFLLNLIPIPPLDGSKIITEPLAEFFTILGVKRNRIDIAVNIISLIGVVLMFIPKISNIIIVFIREHLRDTLFLNILILVLMCSLISQLKGYRE